MDKMSIYNRLPIFAQNFACFIEGSKIKKNRYGQLFWKKLEEYEERDVWSYERKCEYRDAQIRKMVRHCYDTVPYYHGLFDEGGINPDCIRCLDDLKVIPILSKDIVNKNPELFLSTEISRDKMLTAHTSGTTGAGFIFRTTEETICEQWAVWWRYRRKLGIQFGTLSANFGTRFVVPTSQKRPPFWRYNTPCSQVYFSAFHEKPEYLRYYLEEIRRKKITWIHGYPSLISELANVVLLEKDDEIKNQIQYVTIGAENLLDYQKTAIEKAFDVHVYQHYGLSEGVSNFSENPEKDIIVDEDFAATEFVDSNGYKRIVGTTLTNFAMPLLRWDTKDTAGVREIRGIGRIVDSLDGRIEDYITLPSGKVIGKLDHVFKDAIHLKEVQIVQDKNYKIQVLFVPRDDNYESDIKMAYHLFLQTFGEKVDIEFARKESIEKSKSGKLRFIVSDVSRVN